MHKLCEYIDNETMDLERKSVNGRLSNSDIERGNMLAQWKKNLLTADAMQGNSGADRYSRYSGVEYRNDGNRLYSRSDSYDDESYARRRDSMGRYSKEAKDEMVEKLYKAMDKTQDMQSRQAIREAIKEFERD